jgi:hypothetical protein
MKRLTQSLVVAFCVSAIDTVGANGFFNDFSPYIGIDAKGQSSEGRGQWKHILSEDYYWGGTVYVAGKIWEYFGLEAGYSRTADRSKTHLFGTGEDFYGNGDTGGASMKVTNRFSSWHVDMNGFFPLDECWDIVGSVGYGWVKPEIKVRIPAVAAPGINPNLFTTPGFFPRDADALSTIHGKTKGVLRLGVGVQAMVDDCMGLRLMARWENTGSTRIHGNFDQRDRRSTIDYNALKKMFKDTYSVALGIFWKFS